MKEILKPLFCMSIIATAMFLFNVDKISIAEFYIIISLNLILLELLNKK